MKVDELRIVLKKINVPSYYYSLLLGGYPNECLCLVKNNDSDWEVYYSERGRKTGEKHYKTEDEACNYMFEILSEYGRNNI